MSTPTTTTAPGPARALAPDLARGVMLLLIALANVAYWLPLRGMPVGTHSEPETTVDAVAQAVMLMAVDQRALPMFALLFGYSMVQFGRSQQARGLPWEAFRATLDRRHLGLALLGLAHTVLLWSGDILGGYAVLGIVLTYAFYRRPDRTVRLWRNALAWVMAGVAGLVALFTPLVMWALAMGRETLTGEGLDLDALIRESAQEIGRASDASWLVDLPERLAVWLGASITMPLVLTVTVPMLTGLLWARRGLLDRPAEHRRELTRIAAVGIPAAWLGGLPLALTPLGVWPDPVSPLLTTGVHLATGVLGGLGYAALLGLVAARLEGRAGALPAPARALSALGRMSLSGYLLLTALMAPLLAGWGLGLGRDLGTAASLGIAAAAWLVALALAVVLDRAGRRGPAELLLRRITHGPRRAPTPAR